MLKLKFCDKLYILKIKQTFDFNFKLHFRDLMEKIRENSYS